MAALFAHLEEDLLVLIMQWVQRGVDDELPPLVAWNKQVLRLRAVSKTWCNAIALPHALHCPSTPDIPNAFPPAVQPNTTMITIDHHQLETFVWARVLGHGCRALCLRRLYPQEDDKPYPAALAREVVVRCKHLRFLGIMFDMALEDVVTLLKGVLPQLNHLDLRLMETPDADDMARLAATCPGLEKLRIAVKDQAHNGVSLTSFKPFSNLMEVHMQAHCTVQDIIETLKACPRLDDIMIFKSLDDEDTFDFDGQDCSILGQLRTLDVDLVHLGRSGSRLLAECGNLTSLSCENATPPEGSSIGQVIRALTCTLSRLALSDNVYDTDVIMICEAQPALICLAVKECHLTDRALSSIQNLHALKTLDLESSVEHLTVRALKDMVQACSQLAHLYLSDDFEGGVDVAAAMAEATGPEEPHVTLFRGMEHILRERGGEVGWVGTMASWDG